VAPRGASGGDAEVAGHLVATDRPDVARVAHDDQPVGRPRQPDVELLPVAVVHLVLVDAQHHGPALQPLATEDVSVEHVRVVPEGGPVGLGVGVGVLLPRVPAADSEQRDVLGAPALLEQLEHLLLGRLERPLLGALHPRHVGSVPTEQPHPVRCQRVDGTADLGGVAQVVVQDQRYERNRWRAEPAEHPLVGVGVEVEPAALLVLERPEDGLPPQVGEVLRLVHDEGVVAVAGVEGTRQVGHLLRQRLLVVARGPGGAGRGLHPLEPVVLRLGAPELAQLLEGPDERRSLLARPRPGHPAEERGQATGVADEGDPLGAAPVRPPSSGELAHLLEGEDGLARARPTTDLDTVQQPGEPLRLGVALVRLGRHRELRAVAAPQDLADQLHVLEVRHPVAGLLTGDHLAEPVTQVGQVSLVLDQPAWCVRRGEVVVELGVGERDGVAPPDPRAAAVAPARVALDVVTRGVEPLAGLVHGLDPTHVSAAAALLPPLAGVPDRPALDLDRDHAIAGHQDEQVHLVVLGAVDEPLVGDEDVLRAQLLPQDVEHGVLGVRLEPRRLG
jgi:hypothetical protein